MNIINHETEDQLTSLMEEYIQYAQRLNIIGTPPTEILYEAVNDMLKSSSTIMSLLNDLNAKLLVKVKFSSNQRNVDIVNVQNPYTIYRLDGKKEIIYGQNINKAFTKAGYGSGASNAVDWYDDGITDTHYFDINEKLWVQYKPKVVTPEEVITAIHIDANKFNNDLYTWIVKRHEVVIVYPNKDQLSVQLKWFHFAIGWVYAAEITYGEYHVGSYFGDDSTDHHYIAVSTEYHPSADLLVICSAFVERLDDPTKCSSRVSCLLEDLYNQQSSLRGETE